jgi:hypothetical protein
MLGASVKDDRAKQLLTKKELKFVKNFALISKDNLKKITNLQLNEQKVFRHKKQTQIKDYQDGK